MYLVYVEAIQFAYHVTQVPVSPADSMVLYLPSWLVYLSSSNVSVNFKTCCR